MSETREIQAPRAYLFGKGVVIIARGLEADGKQRGQIILRENWEALAPFQESIPSGHPQSFMSPEEPIYPPDDCTALIFENAEGIQNLIHELIALHALRYPGRAIPGLSGGFVDAVLAAKQHPEDAVIFARVEESQ